MQRYQIKTYVLARLKINVKYSAAGANLSVFSASSSPLLYAYYLQIVRKSYDRRYLVVIFKASVFKQLKCLTKLLLYTCLRCFSLAIL